jgi:hypothetical protein
MADDVDPARLAVFELLVELTAPPPDNPCRCTCDRCVAARKRGGS